MPTVQYRLTEEFDIPAMARIRALEWGTEQYWEERIARYVKCENDPQQALTSRVGYVASEGDSLVGFIAGHLTRRYGCDGELQWINVIPQLRGGDVAAQLLRQLAAWFIEQRASRICVDVEPANTAARRFYERHGAEDLNTHWLVWSDIKVVLAE
jgi:ribosomal protein S18 acetylase RimI-like enzyme